MFAILRRSFPRAERCQSHAIRDPMAKGIVDSLRTGSSSCDGFRPVGTTENWSISVRWQGQIRKKLRDLRAPLSGGQLPKIGQLAEANTD